MIIVPPKSVFMNLSISRTIIMSLLKDTRELKAIPIFSVLPNILKEVHYFIALSIKDTSTPGNWWPFYIMKEPMSTLKSSSSISTIIMTVQLRFRVFLIQFQYTNSEERLWWMWISESIITRSSTLMPMAWNYKEDSSTIDQPGICKLLNTFHLTTILSLRLSW